MHNLIDTTNPDFRSDGMRDKFGAERGCYPSAIYTRLQDNCDCCDHDMEESQWRAFRCYQVDFEFGGRWKFSLLHHRHVDGDNYEVHMDRYKDGNFYGTQTFSDMKMGKHGNLSPMAQAENAMLDCMGAPPGWRFEEKPA